jgi:hypothetical protein
MNFKSYFVSDYIYAVHIKAEYHYGTVIIRRMYYTFSRHYITVSVRGLTLPPFYRDKVLALTDVTTQEIKIIHLVILFLTIKFSIKH